MLQILQQKYSTSGPDTVGLSHIKDYIPAGNGL